jgi:predicted amino acid racemase
VLLYVLLVCKCVLPPGDNPISINKYITLNRYSSDNGHVILCLVRFIHFTEGTYMSLEVNLSGEVVVTRISKSDGVEVKRT